jgi:hypothetical protein
MRPIAAAFALPVGSFAEATLSRSTEEAAKVVAERVVVGESPQPSPLAG